jgi:hypothetical protein
LPAPLALSIAAGNVAAWRGEPETPPSAPCTAFSTWSLEGGTNSAARGLQDRCSFDDHRYFRMSFAQKNVVAFSVVAHTRLVNTLTKQGSVCIQ